MQAERKRTEQKVDKAGHTSHAERRKHGEKR